MECQLLLIARKYNKIMDFAPFFLTWQQEKIHSEICGQGCCRNENFGI